MDNTNLAITVFTTINAPITFVWKCWTTPADIMQWNNPTSDWHTPVVEVELNEGGRFLYKMGLKDGSFGFDHAGVYDKIIVQELIEYTGIDGRKSIINFKTISDAVTTVTETFVPDAETPIDIQKEFCQNVLDNFKHYTESLFNF